VASRRLGVERVAVLVTNESEPTCDLVGNDATGVAALDESARYPGLRSSVGSWLDGTHFEGVSK